MTNANTGVQCTPSTETNEATIATVKATPRTKRIGKVKASELILGNRGKFFNVTVMEKNKSKAKGAPERVARVMTCRIQNFPTNPNATRKAPTAEQLLKLGKVRVMEVTGDKGIKTLDLSNIIVLKAGGDTYKVG